MSLIGNIVFQEELYMNDTLKKTIEELKKRKASIYASSNEFEKFLDTASNLYKYSFEDQLLIYAKKPSAIACAEYSLWNEKVNRYVKKGTEGIPLLKEENGKLKLKIASINIRKK